MAFGNRFILFFILMIISQSYAEARSPATYSTMVTVEQEVPGDKAKIPETLERNEQLCPLCEEYAALATDYLDANKTEAEIIDSLRNACSQLHSHEQQCVILVDYYSPIFFREIARIRAGEICMLCHRVVDGILTKLKNPVSQLEIIKKLLNDCNILGPFAQQCNLLVMRYVPLVLVAVKTLLESKDICAFIPACTPKQEEFGYANLAE